MFNAVIYDLDGTLVDSAPVVAAVLNKLRRKIGLPALPQKSYYRWISMGGLELVGNALNVPPNRSEVYLSEFRAMYLDEPVPMNSLYPGVHDVLQLLKNSEIKLGICTNKPRKLAEKVLKDTGITQFFDHVVAGDDLPTKKPHIDNVNASLKALGAAPRRTLFVGDSTVDQRSAENAGIAFAFFSLGYDDGVNQTRTAFNFDEHSDLIMQLNKC